MGKVMWFLHMGSDLGCPSPSLESGSNWINTGLGGGGVEIQCLPGLWEVTILLHLKQKEKMHQQTRSFTWKERLGKQDVLQPGSGEINTEFEGHEQPGDQRALIILGARDVSLTSPKWRGIIVSTALCSGSGPSKQPFWGMIRLNSKRFFSTWRTVTEHSCKPLCALSHLMFPPTSDTGYYYYLGITDDRTGSQRVIHLPNVT